MTIQIPKFLIPQLTVKLWNKYLSQPTVKFAEASTNLKSMSDLTKQNLQSTTHQRIETYGVFQTYPTGIFNPACTGMYTWELDQGHIMNEYKICKYHSIKSGVILCGNDTYIFTPISNGDIFSYLKILLKKLQY